MGRIVLLTPELSERLDGLTKVEDEMNGVLFYKPQNTESTQYCPLIKLFLTGVGSPGHVISEPQRIEIVNDFLRANSEYSFVKFHTHSVGTIRLYGNYYSSNFSEGDIQSYNEQIRFDPNFIGMLVTSQTKLLYGLDNPILKPARCTSNSEEEKITSQLATIASKKGYSLERFLARQRTPIQVVPSYQPIQRTPTPIVSNYQPRQKDLFEKIEDFFKDIFN